jgi:hypothetical protein
MFWVISLICQLCSLPASTTFGCKEYVNKENAYNASSVFKISINKYSNHWHLSVTLSLIGGGGGGGGGGGLRILFKRSVADC